MPEAPLLDLMLEPPVREPVVPGGEVLKGPPDETLKLCRGPIRASITVHRHRTRGLWMWAVTWQHDSVGGGGYRVGEKWGKYAASRDLAVHWAVRELQERLRRDRGTADPRLLRPIAAWAESVDPF